MKNWKTTLAGLLAALPIAYDALLTAYNAGVPINPINHCYH